MCTNGINAQQFGQMIRQISDHVRLERRWSHDLAHQAEDAGYAKASEKLHAAMAMLDEARAMLDDADDALDDDAASVADIKVSLV